MLFGVKGGVFVAAAEEADVLDNNSWTDDLRFNFSQAAWLTSGEIAIKSYPSLSISLSLFLVQFLVEFCSFIALFLKIHVSRLFQLDFLVQICNFIG